MNASDRRILRGMSFALCMTVARSASADGSPQIVAEELFTTGRALLEIGEVDSACPKLAESERLDPAGGTALLLGMCYERQGRFATAWATLRAARVMAIRDGRRDRIAAAEERLQAISLRLAHVIVRIAPSADVPGLRVLLDGVELGEASRETTVPIDPGPHDLRATAPGYPPFSTTFGVPPVAGVTQAVVGPFGEEKPASSPPTVPIVAVGSLGVVALGVTVVFGVEAIRAAADEPTSCLSTDSGCLDRRRSLETQRSTDATVATVAGVAAGAAGAGALVLAVLPHRARDKSQTWTVKPFASAGLALSCAF
jgi:hypothetical protein